MVYKSIDHRKVLSICFFTITRKNTTGFGFYFSLRKRSASKTEWIRRLVCKETVVLRRWGVERNVWSINRVDN